VSTFFTGTTTSSVEVCADRSVLVTAINESEVHRLTLSGTGTLADTGEVLSSPTPANVYCAPSATSGVVLNFSSPGMTSFSIPGLAPVDNRNLSGTSGGSSGTINSSGNRVFARSQDPGSIDVLDFNSATGALGANPLLTIPVVDATSIFGLEKIALHPNDAKLFVPEFGVLNIYNSSTGVLIASITDPAIEQPVSVAVQAERDPCALPPPAGAIVGTNGPNALVGTSGNDAIFGLGGNDTIDGKGGDDLICGGPGSDVINGGSGNDTIDGGSGNDAINAGSGSDIVRGSSGNDTINVKDSVSGNDKADGGPGSDVCAADPGDTKLNCNP
jgi:Ca2+-binding RTX toxin-like protein